MNTESMTLVGEVSEISRAELYADRQERVAVQVEGAEPFFAELLLPNERGWVVGQRLIIMIRPTALAGEFIAAA